MRLKSAANALIFSLLFLLFGCETQTVIVNDVPEREANEIIVFLASKGISADKTVSPSAGPGADTSGGTKWSISVEEKNEIEAMAILNRNGLPRKKGLNLLDLFSKSGLVSSAKEENIRYQAGLAAQIAGTIRKIDGVIEADVELSIPQDDGTTLPGMQGQGPVKKITAAVYVKHQGILDDPNSHLITKIKRLVSGSVSGLDLNDVTVISDRSRFTDVSVKPVSEEITPKTKDYVSIWSIVLSKGSTGRFRLLFFTLIFALIVLGVVVGWIVWKCYPLLRKQGFKGLLNPAPFRSEERNESPPSENPQ